jgi:transposase
VDLSKHFLDCFLLPDKSHFRLSNDSAGVSQLCDRARELIRNGAQVRLVIEASGGYERLLHEQLTAAAVPVAIVNPKRVRAYAKGIGRLAKTDRVDAQVLARYGVTEEPRPTPAADPERVALREMLAYRDQILAELSARTQQLSGYRSPAVRARAEREITHLKAERDSLAREIAQRIQQTPALAALAGQLCSVPGVGPLVTAVLLAHLPELGQLDGNCLASLAGLAPFAQDSGTYAGQRTIQGGRARVRASLYLAALVGIRRNPVLQAFYDRLTTAGKPGKVALTACMRKLLVILNALVRTNTLWQPDHSPAKTT